MRTRSRRYAIGLSLLAILLLLLAWAFHDPALRPEVRQRLDQAHAFDDSPGNAFFTLAGMGHPDPSATGRDWVVKLQQHLAQGGKAPWPSLPDTPKALDAKPATECEAFSQRCFTTPPTEPIAPAQQQLDTQYRLFLQQPVYGEYIDALLSDVATPLPAYRVVTQAQRLFHAGLVLPSVAPQPRLDALLQERAGLTRMLRGANSLIGKMVALNMAQRHDLFVHDALQSGRLPAGAASAALVLPWDPEAVSVMPALMNELQGQLRLVNGLIDAQANPFATLEEPESTWSRWPKPLQGVALRVAFKRNASLNRLHRQFMQALADTPAQRPDEGSDAWVLNPVGKILTDIATPNYTTYRDRGVMLGRLHNALAQCRDTRAATVPIDWLSPPAERQRIKPRLADDGSLRC